MNALPLSSGFLANCRSESRLHQRIRKAWMILQSLITTVKFEHQGSIDCLKLQLFYISSGLSISWSRKRLHDGSWNLLPVLGLVAHTSISYPSSTLLCNTRRLTTSGKGVSDFLDWPFVWCNHPTSVSASQPPFSHPGIQFK